METTQRMKGMELKTFLFIVNSSVFIEKSKCDTLQPFLEPFFCEAG